MEIDKRNLPIGEKKRISFEFDSKQYVGYEGDTLAAALLRNKVSVVGRSFKLHRPRGVMGSGLEESNALVQLEKGAYTEPNVRATMIPLYDGLRATSQNAWPNVRNDWLGVLDKFHRMLPASFYYKTMKWPNWSFYERFVRPLAGLGRSPLVSDPQNYAKQNLHCDVFIVGGGVAGLAAASALATTGLRIVVVDDKDEFGGALLGENYQINGQSALIWKDRTVEMLSRMDNVRLLPRTTVSGYYESNFLVASERLTNHIGPVADPKLARERLWRVRATQVILATGAMERPMAFPNNDRPGVMLSSAVRTYVNRFGLFRERSAVVVTNNDSAYRTVTDLSNQGVKVVAVVDTRSTVDAALRAKVEKAGATLYNGYAIRQLHGRKQVKAIELAKHLGKGVLASETITVACDLVAMSSGWTPTVHLYSQAGGSLDYDANKVALVPAKCSQKLDAIGAANGEFTLESCFASAQKAVTSLLSELQLGDRSRLLYAADSFEKELTGIQEYWYAKDLKTDKQWLDFQYDVKVSDIELALRENFVSVEHVKRYTTGGMSVDQGKTGNFNILAIMAEVLGKRIPEVGTTKFRPPFQPVTIGSFAGKSVGEGYAPWGELPAKSFHQKHKAVFDDYGWKRPGYYPRQGESMEAATHREVHAVRNTVGMFDGAPLGKIEVKGPDAATFLNRMYVNNLSTLKPLFARYAVMTNENGVLIDDGVIVRLAEDHFLVHATSAAVGRVFLMMEEYLQCEWPDLKVHVTNCTTQWANVTVSGPQAHLVMAKLGTDIDFDTQKFKHMQFRRGSLDGVSVRVLRASFTGEATYEVSVPTRYAQSLWELIEEAGAEFGITPYGIEALEVMRTEKGYLHVGSDTDGSSNPLDIGFARIIANKQGDFVGRRSLMRPGDQREDRLQFVGIEPVDGTQKLTIGGHVLTAGKFSLPAKSEGYVTSSCYSPTLKKQIGLAIISAGVSRKGEIVSVFANGAVVQARIVAPTHYDPEGEKLNA